MVVVVCEGTTGVDATLTFSFLIAAAAADEDANDEDECDVILEVRSNSSNYAV